MPLFDIPLPAPVRRSITSRKYALDGPSTKRKRNRVSSESSSSDDDLNLSANNDDLLVQSTNPLSLTPDEIAQYRLAGLSLNKQLPQAKGLVDWPHRGFAAEVELHNTQDEGKSGAGEHSGGATRSVESDSQEKNGDEFHASQSIRTPHGHRLRLQHLNVLTAVVHKCLLEGDIPRATRAYSLLIRSEPAGKALDLKTTGYWGIGAELLVRSSQQGKSNKFHHIYDSNSDSDLDDDTERVHNTNTEKDIGAEGKTWGSKQGFELAKSYYETLIIQYPYKKQNHAFVSSLDFWSAMAACEIYGIQAEYRKGFEKLPERYDSESATSSDNDSDREDIFADAHEYIGGSVTGSPTASNSKQRARKYHKMDKIWVQKSNIRVSALSASEALSARMDEIMSRPPFDRDRSMLRLRGMLGLYIGDLNVPVKPVEPPEGDDDRERRFLFLQRKSEYERGVIRKLELWESTRKVFDKCRAEGGPDIDLDNLLQSEIVEEENLDQIEQHSPDEYTED
ncbi:hypothetical protein GLAREA_06131 [Glarea lozoyensis ATCC 20868]|uniref:Uncharacterized protein n=1 Tax=Glarea lozoyensis (strain ATCC 20868 / MF5171) TaxID=1116229 RepID=S3D7M0_GLAL2|nr:uncharacterized protein GLAREA_06131 [Glarea lozoyensis ATCC 20868]EPE33119.1 hypothetical protein GLAREA_06131 [Glarea lozoyensis ATCC 20868]